MSAIIYPFPAPDDGRREPHRSHRAGLLTPSLRKRIGDVIETLIAVLDDEDGDADLEQDAGEEPEPDDEGDPLDLGEHDEADGLA